MDFDQQRTWDLLNNQVGNYYSQTTDEEREIFRTWTQGVLRQQEVMLTFVRADGAERVMRATLQESQIPKIDTTKTERKYNEHVCVVWDCEQQAWRSFRWDRLKKIEIEIG